MTMKLKIIKISLVIIKWLNIAPKRENNQCKQKKSTASFLLIEYKKSIVQRHNLQYPISQWSWSCFVISTWNVNLLADTLINS